MVTDLSNEIEGKGREGGGGEEGEKKLLHTQYFENSCTHDIVLTRYCDYGENVGGDEDGKR